MKSLNEVLLENLKSKTLLKEIKSSEKVQQDYLNQLNSVACSSEILHKKVAQDKRQESKTKMLTDIIWSGTKII